MALGPRIGAATVMSGHRRISAFAATDASRDVHGILIPGRGFYFMCCRVRLV